MSLFSFITMPGPFEMLIIGVVMLLLFGNRLPSVMRSLGRGVVEFKKGINGIEDDLNNSQNQAAVKDSRPAEAKEEPKV